MALVSRIVVVGIVEVATCVVWIVLVVEPLISSGEVYVFLLLLRLLGKVDLLVGVRILELSALIIVMILILLELCRL